MARKSKQIIIDNGIDRRDSGYYSTPAKVTQYIHCRLKEIKPNGQTVIDPCVGQEELIEPFLDDCEVSLGIDIVNHKSNYRCEFFNQDFLELYKHYKQDDLFCSTKLPFHDADYWIANPPYNCHEVDYIKSKKKELKKVFNDVGVHNMYSMFISAMIDLAKDGAVLGIITLDSFLTSKAHKDLRKKILSKCKIHDIILCPTSLFRDQNADVRTCIIILEKIDSDGGENVFLLNRTSSNSEFYQKLENREFSSENISGITLSSERDNCELLIGVPDDIKKLFLNKRVADLYRCITGISTGNDKKYLRQFKEKGYSVPFYKNPGSRKFYCEEDGYLIDDFLEENERVSNFMVRNIPLIFKPGITCSSMGVEFSACYLPPNVTFGVNPNIICPEEDIWWLLAYLNSNLVKYLIRGILIRTNMVTSGYVSRLPVGNFSDQERLELSEISKDIYDNCKNGGEIDENKLNRLNLIIYDSHSISTSSRSAIESFCSDIVKKA